MKNLLSIILFLAVAPVTVADNHGTIENRPVETWMCSFNEGQTMADLDEWYVAFNEHAETMQNNSFNSFVWVPTFVSDLKAADVALTFSFPTLTEMGTTMDEFLRQHDRHILCPHTPIVKGSLSKNSCSIGYSSSLDSEE